MTLHFNHFFELVNIVCDMTSKQSAKHFQRKPKKIEIKTRNRKGEELSKLVE